MKRSEIKSELASIYANGLDTADGVSTAEIMDRFLDLHPHAQYEVGTEMFHDWLRRLSAEIVKGDAGAQGVLDLPEFGAIPATVTVPDGEGGYRRKSIARATAADLLADNAIIHANHAAVTESMARSDLAVRGLLPIMEREGFEVAGPAIALLGGAS